MKIYNIDRELYRTYKIQKVVNGLLLNKATIERRKNRLLEKVIGMLSIGIPRDTYPDES